MAVEAQIIISFLAMPHNKPKTVNHKHSRLGKVHEIAAKVLTTFHDHTHGDSNRGRNKIPNTRKRTSTENTEEHATYSHINQTAPRRGVQLLVL